MKIGDCMKRQVVSVSQSTSVQHAAQIVVEKHVGTLPVVDGQDVLIGVTRVYDVLKVFMPDFVSLLENIDFVKDFGAFEMPSGGDLERAEDLAVADIMGAPVAVEEDSSLIRALSVIEKYGLLDLSVVKEGQLVGIASRVDIGRAFIAGWQTYRDEHLGVP